jgi:hypothetical protein
MFAQDHCPVQTEMSVALTMNKQGSCQGSVLAPGWMCLRLARVWQWQTPRLTE